MAEYEKRLRLKLIKLVGFKSFVDPTTVNLPGNLIGIVGPNGCGKSNVIDAVRWVMGESSAKHLRGESMADVIFNGSTTRKSVGQASIELVFNNPDGAIGGEYAKYNEIAIRRQVNREGQSNYYLNNTRCRRKDIVDIFLGTGLGSRSYAIIGQGTVSRIIEAKPEELRIYLEEAAGISKFKERRRETENRMQHTRDNLDRLSDLREELDKQLNHLQKQSQAALQYKELKQQERLYKSQLLTLRWQSFHRELQQHATQLLQQNVNLEALNAKVEKANAVIEEYRQRVFEGHEEVSAVQEHFYSICTELARVEQSLSHQKERSQQLKQDISDIECTLEEATLHTTEDGNRIEVLHQEISKIMPLLQEIEEKFQISNEKKTVAEETTLHWQAEWEIFNQKSAEVSQIASVQQTRIQHLEQTINTSKIKIQRLDQEEAQLDVQGIEHELHQLQQNASKVEEAFSLEQEKLEQIKETLYQQRQEVQLFAKQQDEARKHLQQLRGQYVSLEALQQAALGQGNHQITEWLDKNHFSAHQRLGQCVDVEKGWEQAVETVLGNFIQAVCVDNLDPVVAAINSFEQGELIAYDIHHDYEYSNQVIAERIPLSKKIKAHDSVTALLSNIYCCETLEEALTLRSKLMPYESVVTAEGLWLGHAWLRVIKKTDKTSGILKREQQLKELFSTVNEEQQRVDELEQQLGQAQLQLEELEQQLTQQQQVYFSINKQKADMHATLQVKQNRFEQMQNRILRLKQDSNEQVEIIERSESELQTARQHWQEALDKMGEFASEREVRLSEKENCIALLENAKREAETLRNELQQTHLKKRTLETELATKLSQYHRLQQQVIQLSERKQILQQSFAAALQPIDTLQASLQEKLEQRLQKEQELNQMRIHVQNFEQELKQFESQKNVLEDEVEQLRNLHEKVKLEKQGLEVRCAAIEEQLQQEGHILDEILNLLPEEANEIQWEQEIATLERTIQRLGPINLAAIEEYKAQAERKTYLDSQHEDLVKALTTLEEAIRKIDKETKQKFKDTYDTVNQYFQTLFPRIFGGGSAYLEMTDEDLLETGITVMARPPGKKNTTIHLLSGGEKALTAIALVFSIFQLNPAPFCMLDEVDAPLDDANVLRLCNLLKEMAKDIQFIFISHNKLAIEMAECLIGVTMKEPGVSRIVTVNIDEAVAMAEA